MASSGFRSCGALSMKTDEHDVVVPRSRHRLLLTDAHAVLVVSLASVSS